jgi:aryl-alcohol dehydrogenase-like predicted oxidoreductase
VGFGAVKIGRSAGLKYPTGFTLPEEDDVTRLLHQLLDAGITYFDTAPAYGLSEERIGKALASRRDRFTLTTKVGESFDEATATSTYDFSPKAITLSVERSLKRLRTDHLDGVFIHSDGNDTVIQRKTGVIEALQTLKKQGKTRLIGLSGKTVEGAQEALQWADVLMVAYHRDDTTHEPVMREAHQHGLGVVVKKGLGSGHLPADMALAFLADKPFIDSVVIGSLKLEHMLHNLRLMQG